MISDWKIKQVVFSQVLDEVSALFAAAGFTFMPIKGAYLIMSGLADSISERQMRDIDLLIPPDRFEEACTWFATLENVSTAPNYWNFERSFIYTSGKTSAYLEFHRQINFPARFHLPSEDLFSRSTAISRSVMFPDPTDALLIHVCHMLPHVIDGFKKGTIDEIGIYLAQPQFSWDEFWKRAKTTGISDFIWLIINLFKVTHEKTRPLISMQPSWYAYLLIQTHLFQTVTPPLLRKLLFELPFVRNPWRLLWYKWKNRKKLRCKGTHPVA